MSIFEGFEDNPEPLTPEQVNLQTVDKLISRAKKAEHSKFEFIRALNEYSCVKDFRHAVLKISEKFNKSSDQIFHSYFKELKKGVSKLDLLLAGKEMAKIAVFYKDEAAVADDMLAEYGSYLGAGHAIDAFMGVYRPEIDLHDFRVKNASKQ